MGEVQVTRSAVNTTTGGYTWTVQFLSQPENLAGGEPNPECDAADPILMGCPAAGDIVGITIDTAGSGGAEPLTGTLLETDIQEQVRGNVLIGNFSLSVFSPYSGEVHSSANVSVRATADDLDAAIESADSNVNGSPGLGVSGVTGLVEVSREIADRYGSRNFVITFTSNPHNFPLGAGDLPLLAITNNTVDETGANTSTSGCAACELATANARVEESQAGSDGLEGTFDLNLGAAANGPITVDFNETDAEVEASLDGLNTIGDVFVTRAEVGAGWDGTAVAVDGTRGGYAWTVRFVENFGSSNGRSFPPGSGDVSPLVADFTSLTGNGAFVGIVETVSGSEALAGRFNFSVDGAQASLPGIRYDASANEVEAALEELSTVGTVSVHREFRIASPVPRSGSDLSNATSGHHAIVVSASAQRGDTDLATTQDLRGWLARGDLVRISGARPVPLPTNGTVL